MNKKHLIVAWVIVFLLIIPVCRADDSKENVDWDKLDYKLYQDLKQQTGAAESEINQAMGGTHLEYENWDRASIYFNKAVALDPKLYWSWYNLALLNMDTEEGNEYLKKAIEANPDYPPPYYWLAYTYCRHDRDEEAVPIFEKFLEVAEGDPNEAGRIRTATKILQELSSGEDEEELQTIRARYE